MDTHPYYQSRRAMPVPQNSELFAIDRVDLQSRHLPPYPQPDGSGALPDSRPLANSLFDARAAAAVCAAVGNPFEVPNFNSLLERKGYGDEGSTILIPTPKCLAAMAFGDYFPSDVNGPRLRGMVSDAIMAASPGWCGTSGPGWDDCKPKWEGNYDMAQMFLLPLAYAYYDQLTQAAREKLITQLLAQGAIDRDNVPLIWSSGFAPDDWFTVGHCDVKVLGVGSQTDIPETENHVLMIATARYLTNQLLYQRHRLQPDNDNRRNGCMDQVLLLLRNKLRDDFAEYNAKTYQEETRHALLNLYSYAYDAEVRLGAGMVLDYVSAHIAVSSCDLRRMVPFRRRNEDMNVHQDPSGFMDVSLLESSIPPGGADPMPAHFALHAGNTRAYQFPDNRVWPPGAPGPAARPWSWAITPNFGSEMLLEAVCDHRLAPSVHDLFVNDLHRRFFQRLHRFSLMQEPGGQRNCDNMEIYAGSPSYLISAGGRPAVWVIPGKEILGLDIGFQDQNLGVAVPISFMPTSGGNYNAIDVIQIMHFSAAPTDENGISATGQGGTENYGVAPDFACGVSAHFPSSSGIPESGDGVFFAEHRPTATELAGYYLAVYRKQDFVVLEAFDIWRHPEVSFDAFKSRVLSNNPSVTFASAQKSVYTTYFGNRIHYVIWKNLEFDNHIVGSNILQIEYAAGDPADTLADAGNDIAPFLSGTIMRSPRDGIVEIHNPSLGTTLTLDWSDPHHLIRTSETGAVQQAGAGYEIWVDFAWTGPSEGDFYRPFNTLEGALNAAADGGVIRIMAGAKRERLAIHKRVRLTAAGGAVTLRAH